MISVVAHLKQSQIQSITISGHAGSAKHNELDMVCAQVSACSVGCLNAIDQLTEDSCAIEMESGWVSIQVNKNSETLQIILKTLLIQCETIQFTNSDYIQIEKVEV